MAASLLANIHHDLEVLSVANDSLYSKIQAQVVVEEVTLPNTTSTEGSRTYCERVSSLPPPLSLVRKAQELAALGMTRAFVKIHERHRRHTSVSSAGQFNHDLVLPLSTWFGRNERVLNGQSLGRAHVREEAGTTREVINGASHNYTGFYKATLQGDELQRLCLDKLPITTISDATPLETATHRSIATFFKADFAFTTSTGYGANYLAFPALVDKDTLVVLDEKCHNSIFTGLYLGQPGRIRKFAHNDMLDLEQILKDHIGSFKSTIVVVEGLYSMEATTPPLGHLHQLKLEYDFVLVCDEAHSFLSIGATGRGCLELWNDEHPEAPMPWDLIDLRTGTLSKSVGGIGGFICGATKLESSIRQRVETLRRQGYEFLACSTMVQTLWVLGQPLLTSRRLHHLHAISTFCRAELARFGIFVYGHCATPILPLHVGRATLASKLSYLLRCKGVLAVPIGPPAVPFWEIRVRLNLSPDHTDDDINQLIDAIIEAMQQLGICKKPTNLVRKSFKFEEKIFSSDHEEQEAVKSYNKVRELVHATANQLASRNNATTVGSQDPIDIMVIEEGHFARARYGIGSGGARWICGTQPPHLTVEELVASMTGMQAALVYPDSSIGIASTIAALSRTPIGRKRHFMLVQEHLIAAANDGLLIAPRKDAPDVIRYRDLPDLIKLLTKLSFGKAASKTYLTVYWHVLGASEALQLSDIVRSIQSAPHHLTGMAILIHSPSYLVQRHELAYSKLEPHRQLLVCGSFHQTLAMPGGYLAGSEELIQELKYTSRGYMYTTSHQPFVVAMIQKAIEGKLNKVKLSL